MKTVTLIGIGLIGGSLAADLKQHTTVQIYGIDANPDNLHTAKNKGLVDFALHKLNDDAANADIVVIATPVMIMQEIMQDLAQKIATTGATVITDVGSTKQSTLDAFSRFLPEHLPYCVAAHPIAGSDKSGATVANTGLFAGKKVVICPHDKQHSGSLNAVHNLWQTIGANVITMSALDHDRIFAAVSHLPHILSFAFMQQIIQDKNQIQLLNFAATGFRDFTRLAGSNPAVWAEICLANQVEILSCLSDYKNSMQQLENILKIKDKDALYAFFNQAQQIRQEWEKSLS